MSKHPIDSTDLPALQPHTHCVLIARDPNFIYAYWNYTEEDINHLRNQLMFEGEDPQLILRVYDITGVKFDGSNANHFWDLDVGFSAKNWYIHVWQDDADYCAQLGALCGDNHFIPLMRSNIVRTPPKTASKRDDLIWQDIKLHKESRPYLKENIKDRYQHLMHQHSKKVQRKEENPLRPRVYELSTQDIRSYYMKIFYGVSKKGRGQAPSLENILERKLRGVSWQKVQPFITYPDVLMKAHPGASGELGNRANQGNPQAGASEILINAQSGASEGRLNKRKFFFEVWTELIVHGRTEPDAAVWLNQKGVKLNPDGTFSLRYALPDGEIPLKFIAQSSDGIEQRHINTRVEREQTISFPKMLKGYDG